MVIFAYNVSGNDTITALAISDMATVAQATVLVGDVAAGDVGVLSYNLSDTAVAIAAGAVGVRSGATNITATGAATAAQTTTLLGATNTGSTTIASVMATTAEAIAFTYNATGNDTVTALSVSDSASVAQATTVYTDVTNGDVVAATYNISDTAGNITTALTTGNPGLTAVQSAGTVDASGGAGTLTLTDAQFNNFFTGTSLLAADDTIVVAGNGGTGWVLDNFGGNETLVLSSTSSYFVGMGTSGTTTLHLGGTGNHTIGADDAGALAETFILDAAQNGGSTITGLTAGDMIDIDGANAIAGLTAGQSGAGTFTGAIDTAGEWSYSGSTLTYFAGAALTLTLTGTITTLTMQGNGDTFLVG